MALNSRSEFWAMVQWIGGPICRLDQHAVCIGHPQATIAEARWCIDHLAARSRNFAGHRVEAVGMQGDITQGDMVQPLAGKAAQQYDGFVVLTLALQRGHIAGNRGNQPGFTLKSDSIGEIGNFQR